MSTIEVQGRTDAMHERMHERGIGRDDAAAVVAPVPDARDLVDDASFDSFPASDPPSWMGGRVGPPESFGE
jgi:hypothetical protein